MNQPAAKWRLAGHVARQTPPIRIETGGRFPPRPLPPAPRPAAGRTAAGQRAAIAMNVAGHGADLGVAVAGQRFLNEINNRASRCNAANSVSASRRSGGFGAGGCLGCGAGIGAALARPEDSCHLLGHRRVKQGVEEHPKRQIIRRNISRMIAFRNPTQSQCGTAPTAVKTLDATTTLGWQLYCQACLALRGGSAAPPADRAHRRLWHEGGAHEEYTRRRPPRRGSADNPLPAIQIPLHLLGLGHLAEIGRCGRRPRLAAANACRGLRTPALGAAIAARRSPSAAGRRPTRGAGECPASRARRDTP